MRDSKGNGPFGPDTIYRRVARIGKNGVTTYRYERAGQEFTGWPADGVWFVRNKGASSWLMINEDQLAQLNITSASVLNMHKDGLAGAVDGVLKRHAHGGISINEACDVIIHALSGRK